MQLIVTRSPIAVAVARSPVAAAYLGVSAAILVAVILQPSILQSLVLVSDSDLAFASPWRFVTYAFVPRSILTFALTCAFLIWFARYLEPVIGYVRSATLYLAGAIAGGLVFATLSPEHFALIGGLFVINAAGAALAMFALASQRIVMRRRLLFAAVAIIWVVWTLYKSPMYILLMHASSWLVGVLVFLWSILLSSPNSALPATPSEGAPERER